MSDNKHADPTPMEQLQAMRASIDNFDAALIHILAERFRKTKEVGRLKAKHDLPPSDQIGIPCG